MDSRFSKYSKLTIQEQSTQKYKTGPNYNDSTDLNERTRSKTQLTSQNTRINHPMKTSFIFNHAKHQNTDHLYEPLRQALLLDTTRPEKKKQLQSASQHSHITKVSHCHTIEENRLLAERTLIPQRAKLRKIKNPLNLTLPDKNRYCIVNVSERRLEPISNDQLQSRLSQLKVCKQSRMNCINNLNLQNRLNIQSIEEQDIIVYEYGSSYSNSIVSDSIENTQHNRDYNKLFESRFQFDQVRGGQEQQQKRSVYNSSIPSFIKNRVKQGNKTDYKTTKKQFDTNKSQADQYTNRAQTPEVLTDRVNKYLNQILDSADVQFQTIRKNVNCVPNQQKCRPEQDFCMDQNLYEDYRLPFQRKKIFNTKNNTINLWNNFPHNQSDSTKKYQGFISKTLTIQDATNIAQVKNQPKYNFFSAIDQPVDLLLKNLTKKGISRYNNDNESDQKKPNLLTSYLFCPANQCITKKQQRQINWTIPEREKVKAQLRKQNIDVERGVDFQQH